MMLEAVPGLVSNAALLLLVALLHAAIPLKKDSRRPGHELLLGGALGLIGIGLMVTRWEISPGLFFDTRSVLLAVSGVFFGLVPTGLAAAILVLFRALEGGAGMVTGIGVIISSAAMGVLWRHFLPRRRSWLDYYLLGVAVHLVMLALLFAMPWQMALDTFRQVALPVMGIYPLATVLILKLLEVQRERRAARDHRLRNEHRLRGMLEKSWEIVQLIDAQGRTRYVSDSLRAILGYEAKDVLGNRFPELIHPDDQAEAEALFQALCAVPGETESHVLRLRHRDGRWVWFENVATNLLDDPAIEAVVVNSRDITERRKSEEEAQSWQHLMESVIRHDFVGIAILDRDLHFIFVSDRFLEDYGVRREDAVGRHHYEVFPDLPEKWRRAHRRALAGEVVEGLDDVFVREDGTVETSRWQVRPWYDTAGSIGGILLYTELTTSRKRTEEAYRAVLQTSLEGFWVGDGEGNILEANDTLCRSLGYHREELEGMKVHQVDALESAEDVRRHLAEVRATDGARFLTRHRRKDGSLMDVEVSVTYLDLEGGRFFVFVRDLTAYLEAQRKLEEERQRLENIIEGTNVGTWGWNVRTGDLVLDDRWAGMLGFTLQELQPSTLETWESLTHPRDLEQAWDLLRRHLAGELDAFECEIRMRHKEGHWVWVQSRGKLIDRAEDGSPLRMFGTHADTTERNRMLQDLRASEERFSVAAESLDGILWVMDGDLCLTASKGRGLAAFGLEPDQGVGCPLEEVLGTDEATHPLLRAARRALRGEMVELETRQGDITFSSTFSPMTDGKGRIMGVVGLAVNISGRKRAELALARSEVLYRNLFDRHSAVKLLIDPDTGRIVDANVAAERFYGWTKEELTRMTVSDINNLPPERVTEAMGLVRSDERDYFEFQHRRSDGSIRDVEVFSSRIDVKGKELLHSIVHDITDRRSLEEQLRQSQKMEAIGNLAGGVAHDFNNMLAVIMSTAEMAVDDAEPGTRIHQDLLQINQAAERSAELTRQLLAFSRKQVIRPKPVNLNRIISGQEKMLSRLMGEEIDIDLALRGGLWNVFIDPSQVDQILTNLLVNARDAMGGPGAITVGTNNVQLDESQGREDMPVSSVDYVSLYVSDTGQGMSQEVMDRIFEPFFTTKGQGEGTGLGLATVYGIVKQNGGVIHVYSEMEQGSTFRIYLPRFQGEEAEEAAEKPALLAGTETVLVVEDEGLMRDMIHRSLESQGYRVLSADSPSRALSEAADFQGRIHLLITDVVLPEMNGRQLQERLLESRPEIETLFMSGYSADIIAKRGVLETGVHFIEKPFTMRALTTKAREVLDGGRP